MIRFAEDKDHPQLKALWIQVFGDSAAAVDYYFSHRHQNQNMLVDESNEVIAGMLTMMPVQLAIGQETQRGRYVYAVATAPAYRGQGISSHLLLHCHNQMEKTGETAAILVPASDSLFAFYAQRGYETVFYIDTAAFHPAGLPLFPKGSKCTSCTAQDFHRLRDAAFSDSSLFVKWDQSALEYIISSAKAFGDEVYYIRTEAGEGVAVCGWQNKNVFIRETALININIPDALSILHHTLCAEQYTVRLPEGFVKGAARQPFGMIHYMGEAPALTGKPPYLALVLD